MGQASARVATPPTKYDDIFASTSQASEKPTKCNLPLTETERMAMERGRRRGILPQTPPQNKREIPSRGGIIIDGHELPLDMAKVEEGLKLLEREGLPDFEDIGLDPAFSKKKEKSDGAATFPWDLELREDEKGK